MLYKIDWIEQKEYEGRKYAKASITALDGTEYPEISLGDKWGAKIETLQPGQEIEGNVWQNPKNQKWSLYPIEDKKSPKNFTPKPSALNSAMKRKEESIGKFQDQKAESIALASAQRDAVLIVIEMMDAPECDWKGDGKKIREEITLWRNWFLSEEFKSAPPF